MRGEEEKKREGGGGGGGRKGWRKVDSVHSSVCLSLLRDCFCLGIGQGRDDQNLGFVLLVMVSFVGRLSSSQRQFLHAEMKGKD